MMRQVWKRFRCNVLKAWQGLREWSGDAAYERYVTHVARTGGKKPLTPADFYVEQLNRKYSRPNRCC